MKNIIEIKNLKVSFQNLQVIRGIDIKVKEGEIHGILGESGSGKSVSAYSIMKLHDETCKYEGEIIYKSNNILDMKEKELAHYRGSEVSYIFQNPHESLNPTQKIGKQLKETMSIHGLKSDNKKITDILTSMGLKNIKILFSKYPHQLSGGECQRVMIAMSILCEPSLIIADEPTSAIDATLKKQILKLLKKINEENKTTIIIISHDFDLIEYFCDSVSVMYGGIIFEQGKVEEIIDEPMHPYTKALIKCTNSLDDTKNKLFTLKGIAISPTEFSDACPFYERCDKRKEQCLQGLPKITKIVDRIIRCELYNGVVKC